MVHPIPCPAPCPAHRTPEAQGDKSGQPPPKERVTEKQLEYEEGEGLVKGSREHYITNAHF